MSKNNSTKNNNLHINKIRKTGGNISNISVIIPQSLATTIPLSILNFENTIFVFYLLFCVGAAYYVKGELALNYTNLLLGLTYSKRNQDVCGNTPIERDTIRYTMNKIIDSDESKKASSNAFRVLWVSTSIALLFILWYIFSGKGPIPQMPKYFENIKSYVINILLVITMGFAFAFWYTYTNQISKTQSNSIYLEKINQILKTTLLPKPINITTSSYNPNKLELISSSNNNPTINALYNILFKRMMYVENLKSYQDGINKWNSFTANTDIFPYLIFSNYNTNNITAETIEAQNNLDLWQNELKVNIKLANSKAPDSAPSLNCIEYLSLHTSDSSTNLEIVYNNIKGYNKNNTPKYTYKHSTYKISIPTKLQKKTIEYINTNVLPYLNSSTNLPTNPNHIPSTINGITDYLTVLVGTQNINNDYTILYKYAESSNLTKDELKQTLQNLHWLSTINNGDPSEEIESAMYINKILYYIINVLISYLPFHFFYVNYGALFTLVISIVLLTAFIIIYHIYILTKTRQAENAMIHKNYSV